MSEACQPQHWPASSPLGPREIKSVEPPFAAEEQPPVSHGWRGTARLIKLAAAKHLKLIGVGDQHHVSFCRHVEHDVANRDGGA